MSQNNKCPCKGCPDRYTACSDHCQKPDFLAWKEKNRRIRQARMEKSGLDWYITQQVLKNRRVK